MCIESPYGIAILQLRQKLQIFVHEIILRYLPVWKSPGKNIHARKRLQCVKTGGAMLYASFCRQELPVRDARSVTNESQRLKLYIHNMYARKYMLNP